MWGTIGEQLRPTASIRDSLLPRCPRLRCPALLLRCLEWWAEVGRSLIIIIIIESLSLLQSIPPTANKQTQAQKQRGSRTRKLLGANAKSCRLELKLKLRRLVPKAPTRLAPAGNPPPQLPVQRQLRPVCSRGPRALRSCMAPSFHV